MNQTKTNGLNPGSLLRHDTYRIIRVLGQGGFGITYLAEHTMLDKLVAIKEFFPKDYCDRDENTSHLTIGTKNSIEIVDLLRGKFIKEAKNISKLRHPNIITIHDIFEENNTAYYVMEYIEGLSLSQMIKEQGAMPENKAIGYITKVANAVGYMHSLSMNHLDLKPANIMVRSSDDEPILIDFGLSKQYDASGAQTTTTPVGISHGFAPIEQYRPGGVSTFTPQTDIYALGATLFNLLSGSVPPHYSEILEDGLPKLPASVSQRTANAIEHAMEIKKNKRPATIKEFIEESICEISTDNKKNIIKTTNEPSTKNTFTFEVDNSKVIILPSSEDTMMIGNKVSEKDDSSVHNRLALNNINFVDLGLSVKWADCFWGAVDPYSLGKSFSVGFHDIKNLIPQENLPTIELLRELVEKCIWSPRKISSSIVGYKATGPNGCSIYFPFVYVQSSKQRVSKKRWQTMDKEIFFPSKEDILNEQLFKCKIDEFGASLTTSTIPTYLHFRLIESY